MAENQQRSTFVTVLAWIFIVLSGFGTVIAVLQNIMIQTMFRGPEVSQAMHMPPASGAPPFAVFMASHFQLFFLAFLLVSVFTLVSSIGLLRRWNWARLCFVGIMVLGIAWQFAGVIMQLAMFSSMRQQFSAIAAQNGPDMGPFFIAIAVVGVLFALGLSVLLGWIARKLLSAPIAAEFRRQAVD